MEIAKLLDLSIKQAETNGSKADMSYVHNGREYNNYLDNASWQDFINEMKTLYYPIYENYKNGVNTAARAALARSFSRRLTEF